MQKTQPNIGKDAQLQHLLLHSCSCTAETCTDPSCQHMKQLKSHINDCKVSGCVICRDMSQLIHSHASTCTRDPCPVPSCTLHRSMMYQKALQAHDMLRQLSDLQAHREMFGTGTPDLRQQALLNSHRSSFDNECLSPTSTSKIPRTIPKSPSYQRHFSNERMLGSSSAPYSSCDSSDCGERDDTLIFLPRKKGNSTLEQKISPRAIKRRGRKPKRSSENVLALADKSDSEMSASSDWADKTDPIVLPKRTEDPPEDLFHYSARRLKVARSMSYESDSSASNWGSPLQRSNTFGEEDGWLSSSDTQVHGIDLSDLDIDLRALLCETPAPVQVAELPQVKIMSISRQDTSTSENTSHELVDDVVMGENFDLTLSQLSCDMDDLHVDGDGKLDPCLAMTPVFEDEEDVFKYLDDMST